jgi:hypothetical protein
LAGRWVYTVKCDANGKFVLFKARWVGKRFTQRLHIDYEETYASVTKPATVKMMLSIVASKDLAC